MVWTGPQFQQKHNHSLNPAHAAHAASVANAILNRSGNEGLAIATANAREANRRALGGIAPITAPHMTQHMDQPASHGMVGMMPHVQQAGTHQTGIRFPGLPRRDDGGSVNGMQPTPGLQPNVGNANPMLQQYIQKFSAMSPEQLQELVARLGNSSPLAGIAQRVLQQKRVMPPAPSYTQTAQPTPLSPNQSQQAQPTQQQPMPQQGMQTAQQAARGGSAKPTKATVPILAAGGEFIIAPHYVARLGGGSVKAGHKKLDKFVVERRAQNIKETSELKGPVKE